MAAYSLNTETINSMITSYETKQKETLVTPLSDKQTKYEKLNTTFSDISTKLNALKSSLNTLRYTGNDSAFAVKSSSVSNTSFMSASAGNSAGAGAYSFHVNQLAKNDVAISSTFDSTTSNPITGTHTFQIKTGDGNTGEFVSNIDVDFTTAVTNQSMMETIRDAINSDQAEVLSDAKVGTNSFAGGAGEFTIDLNGTEKKVTFTGGGTYSDLVDEVTSYVNTNIDGVTAEKVVDSPNPGDVRLKLSVDSSSNYISISTSSGYDVVSDLNIDVTKEKAASGMVTASLFTPVSGKSQFSITAKNTGIDNRITSLTDTGTSSALNAVGLNLGTSRSTFNQTTNVPGFVYSDITEADNLLNAKFTFNGLNLQNSLNDVKDLVNNTTFSFKSVMESTDPDVTVKIGSDSETIKTSLQNFVTAFNDIYTYLKEQSRSTADARAILSGQSNASTLLTMLRNVGVSAIPGMGEGNLKYLSQIGITFNSDNGLSISDSSLLEKKLNDSNSQVENMFNNAGSGIATTMYSRVCPYLGAGGYLAKSQTSFTKNVTYIKKQITTTQSNISKSSDNLRDQYQKLQVQLYTLNTMQSQFFGG